MYINIMTQPNIQRIAQNLTDFALTNPDAKEINLVRLPIISPRQYMGTYMDLMWRIICECRTTLHEGDREDLVKHPRYTQDDIYTATEGIKALSRIIKSPETTTDEAIQKVTSLMTAFDRLTTLYLDKAIACNKSIPAYKFQQEKIWDDFYIACQNADYARLAELYPFSDGILELENEHLPENQQCRLRAEALRTVFNDSDTIHPNEIRMELGDPDIGFDPAMIRARTMQVGIYMSLWKTAQTLLEQLEQALPAPRKYPRFDMAELTNMPILRDARP